MFPIPAEVLRHVRENGGVSQTKLAQALGTVASIVSKMEKGEDAEPELADRYLKAVGSELAASVKEFYSRDWRHGEPPSFLHPDREVLWQVDEALTGLEAFERSPKNHPILKGPIELLRAELSGNALYLRRRDHTIAWVGDIGVGKTTALAHAAGLLIGDGRSQRRPAFPVGSGRTTVCETAIRVASTYGIAVDALDDAEVVRLTRDMVTSLTAKASGIGVPSEISRVLRNMSGMKVQTVQTGDDEYDTVDPITQLLDSGLTVDETVDRVVAAMNLASRREQQLVLPEGVSDGLNWLSKLIHNINSGLDNRFGVPKRITVLMPYDNLMADGQVLSVIDTRGVEAVTQRRDLDDHRDDQRTLVVLCSKFADAPSPTTQKFLHDIVEAGSDAADRRRVCVLVLPRDDEALQLPGLDEPLRSRTEGYAIRKRDVAQALIKAKLPAAPVYFFDAIKDDPNKIWASLRGQVAEMRRAYASRIMAASDGVKDLVRNVDIVKTGEARRKIEAESDRLAKAIRDLPTTRRPAHLNLIDQMSSGHHSSIAAAMARGGDWYNFPVFNILGAGVRTDANLRTADHLSRVAHKFDELEVEYRALKDVRQSLVALRALMAEGRQEFLAAAQTIGRDAYGNLLGREQELWDRCEDRYGRGSGYKLDIAKAFQTYFETASAPAQSAASVDKRLQKAWEQFVVAPFLAATRAETAMAEQI